MLYYVYPFHVLNCPVAGMRYSVAGAACSVAGAVCSVAGAHYPVAGVIHTVAGVVCLVDAVHYFVVGEIHSICCRSNLPCSRGHASLRDPNDPLSRTVKLKATESANRKVLALLAPDSSMKDDGFGPSCGLY